MSFSSFELRALLPEPYSIPFWIMISVMGLGIAQLANAISERLAERDLEDEPDLDELEVEELETEELETEELGEPEEDLAEADER